MERIRAAALRAPDGNIWWADPPARHHHIIWRVGMRGVEPARCEQGFMTDAERFAGRQEAAQIALRAGQLSELMAPPNLYSEDLW